MSLSEILHKLQCRTWSERLLLPEALLVLAVMRLAVLLVPFQRTVAFLGLTMEPSILPLPNLQQSALASAIGWSVRAMAARTPWESACLTQALAGMFMLRRRGVPVVLMLGIAKDATVAEKLAAHSWLKCGNTILTGENGHEKYAVISSFTWKCHQ